MTNKQRSVGLIAPRRRTEQEMQVTETAGIGGVPVISRLPLLAGATPSAASAVASGADEGERRPSAEIEPPVVAARSPEKDPATGSDTEHRAATQHWLAAITNFPWNNLLLGLGLAGLVILVVLAASRTRAIVAPPRPPTVHYHINPPPQAGSAVAQTELRAVGPSVSETAAKSAASVHDRPRIALRDVDDAATTFLSEAACETGEQGALTFRNESPMVDRHAPPSASASDYPTTEFPNLPLPGFSASQHRVGARLTGNIEKFKN